MSLAVATGIAPGVWVDEGERAIQTAAEILREQEKAGRSAGKPGQQMNG